MILPRPEEPQQTHQNRSIKRRMRERVEDFGRIMELISQLSDTPIFTLYGQRPKYFKEWFSGLTKDRQADIIHEMAYGIEEISLKLSDIFEIASGQDVYNSSTPE